MFIVGCISLAYLMWPYRLAEMTSSCTGPSGSRTSSKSLPSSTRVTQRHTPSRPSLLRTSESFTLYFKLSFFSNFVVFPHEHFFDDPPDLDSSKLTLSKLFAFYYWDTKTWTNLSYLYLYHPSSSSKRCLCASHGSRHKSWTNDLEVNSRSLLSGENRICLAAWLAGSGLSVAPSCVLPCSLTSTTRVWFTTHDDCYKSHCANIAVVTLQRQVLTEWYD